MRTPFTSGENDFQFFGDEEFKKTHLNKLNEPISLGKRKACEIEMSRFSLGDDLEKTKSDGSSQVVDNEMTNESVWSKAR